MATLRNFGRKMVKSVKAFRANEEGAVTIETLLLIAVGVFLLVAVMKLCGVEIGGELSSDDTGLFPMIKNKIMQYLFGG